MNTHDLKTVQPYFEQVWNRVKLFEIRNNDRNFQQGDQICLQEYIPETDTFTGRVVHGTITYVLHFDALQEGFVAFGFTTNPETIKPIEEVVFDAVKPHYPQLTWEALKSRSRKTEIREPRQIMMNLIAANSNISLKKIGAIFGDRDHTTVIHSKATVQDMVDTNRQYREMMKSITQRLITG